MICKSCATAFSVSYFTTPTWTAVGRGRGHRRRAESRNRTATEICVIEEDGCEKDCVFIMASQKTCSAITREKADSRLGTCDGIFTRIGGCTCRSITFPLSKSRKANSTSELVFSHFTCFRYISIGIFDTTCTTGWCCAGVRITRDSFQKITPAWSRKKTCYICICTFTDSCPCTSCIH